MPVMPGQMPPNSPPPPRPPGPPQGPPPPDKGGNPSELVANIFQQMTELLSMMDQSQAFSPEDKQAFGSIVQAYKQFVEETLGSAPGQRKGPAGPETGVVPEQAGVANVRPAY